MIGHSLSRLVLGVLLGVLLVGASCCRVLVLGHPNVGMSRAMGVLFSGWTLGGVQVLGSNLGVS